MQLSHRELQGWSFSWWRTDRKWRQALFEPEQHVLADLVGIWVDYQLLTSLLKVRSLLDLLKFYYNASATLQKASSFLAWGQSLGIETSGHLFEKGLFNFPNAQFLDFSWHYTAPTTWLCLCLGVLCGPDVSCLQDRTEQYTYTWRKADIPVRTVK